MADSLNCTCDTRYLDLKDVSIFLSRLAALDSWEELAAQATFETFDSFIPSAATSSVSMGRSKFTGAKEEMNHFPFFTYTNKKHHKY